MPTQPEPADRAEVTKLANAVEEALADAMPKFIRVDDPEIPSWEDGPRVGTTAPVPQPDSRFAPRWAVGLAVASIGVGAGATGLGCAAWLFFKGLSMVSVPGLERFAWIVIVSFGGLATAATAIGGLISKAKQAAPPVINQTYTGPVHQDLRNARPSVDQALRAEGLK